MDEHAANYIERISALVEPVEVKLLDAILTGGYDQGCFLRPNDDDLLPASDAAATDAVLAVLAARTVASPSVADPFEHNMLAAQTLAEDEPGFILLSQRCDLVRSLVTEPFVELAAVDLVRDPNAIGVAKRNSPRLIFIAYHPEGAWVADLRRRAVLAKDRLPDYAPRQLVEAGEPHKRLKLRVGQRYSRDALPTDLVERVQRPFVKLLRKPSQMKKVEPFSEFIVFRNDEQVEIAAVFPTTVDRKTADDAWDALEDAMPQELVDLIHEPTSGALSVRDLSFFRYFGGWKLDLDEVTYQSKAGPDQAPPDL